MVTEQANSGCGSKDGDVQRVRALVPLWYATRRWAETLLCLTLKLDVARDILAAPYRGRNRIPGTRWFYRTHGLGVDIDMGVNSGGIDFDFDVQHPDSWRLRIFATKQLNAGAIPVEEYWELVDDEERFTRAADHVVREVAGGLG